MKSTSTVIISGLLTTSLLTACGGGDSNLLPGNNGGTPSNLQPVGDVVEISGGGIKGPLAFADSKIFALDPSFPNFYNEQAPIASSTTDQFARISGLACPKSIKPPYVLTIGGEQAIDLNTGKPPVISTLVTVITKDMLDSKRPVYATPLTTLAFHMALDATESQPDKATFEQNLLEASTLVADRFLIDQTHTIDIFKSPLVIDDSTNTLNKQAQAVFHRAAVEAFAAKVYKLFLSKGDGLRATYFSDMNFSQSAFERIDGAIDFDWQLGSPGNTVASDSFSVRWSGAIEVNDSDEYTFYTSTDDGVRLWVDGQLLIDRWSVQSETEYSAVINLEAGKRYPISMEYYESSGLAAAKLLWSSSVLPKSIVPRDNLHSNYSTASDGITTTDTIIKNLALDLSRDQILDNADHATIIGGIDPAIISMDPMELLIPNTEYRIKDTIALMNEERLYIGTLGKVQFMADSISLSATQSPTTNNNIESAPNPDPVVEDSPTTPVLPVATLSTNALDFGSIDIGGMSNALPVTLSNTGNGPLTLSTITVLGDFIESNDCAGILEPGTSCTMNISFVPAATGNSYGNLTVVSDDSTKTRIVALSGTSDSAPSSTELTPSGPVTISGQQDVVISGLHITNPDGNCVQIRNSSANIIIENSEIGPCGKMGVDIANSENVVVRNSYIHDTEDVGVRIYQSSAVEVSGNQIDRTRTGVYAQVSQQVNVDGNTFHTVNGLYNVNGLNAFIQFGRVTGYGNRVNNNVTVTELGTTDVGDDINIWKSHGMPDDPIQVNNNVIIGSGPRKSGGGIMIGDGGSSYTIAKGNILVNPGASGVAVAGGHDNALIDNTVYSTQLDWSNVGLYVWDQYDSNCHNITVRGNRVNWTKKDGTVEGAWNGKNCGTVEGWSDNEWQAPIGPDIAEGLY